MGGRWRFAAVCAVRLRHRLLGSWVVDAISHSSLDWPNENRGCGGSCSVAQRGPRGLDGQMYPRRRCVGAHDRRPVGRREELGWRMDSVDCSGCGAGERDIDAGHSGNRLATPEGETLAHRGSGIVGPAGSLRGLEALRSEHGEARYRFGLDEPGIPIGMAASENETPGNVSSYRGDGGTVGDRLHCDRPLLRVQEEAPHPCACDISSVFAPCDVTFDAGVCGCQCIQSCIDRFAVSRLRALG